MAAESVVVEEMRAAILRGEFAPRQRLVEAELCERFGAGRFAVRAALQALEGQGLVERQHHRGARIRDVGLAEAIEISQVRMAVEGLVAARAAERATSAEVDHLQDVGRRLRAAVEAQDLLKYHELTDELHRALREVARNATANRVVEQLRGQMVRHQFELALVAGRPSVSVGQQEAIIQAVAAGDPEAAEAAMRVHLRGVIEELEKMAETPG
jgi:DNA-binding GntR family transcriptional regulator